MPCTWRCIRPDIFGQDGEDHWRTSPLYQVVITTIIIVEIFIAVLMVEII